MGLLNFVGKTLKESLNIAKSRGIILEPNGISGNVVKQSIIPGSKIKQNMVCKITMKL